MMSMMVVLSYCIHACILFELTSGEFQAIHMRAHTTKHDRAFSIHGYIYIYIYRYQRVYA